MEGSAPDAVTISISIDEPKLSKEPKLGLPQWVTVPSSTPPPVWPLRIRRTASADSPSSASRRAVGSCEASGRAGAAAGAAAMQRASVGMVRSEQTPKEPENICMPRIAKTSCTAGNEGVKSG